MGHPIRYKYIEFSVRMYSRHGRGVVLVGVMMDHMDAACQGGRRLPHHPTAPRRIDRPALPSLHTQLQHFTLPYSTQLTPFPGYCTNGRPYPSFTRQRDQVAAIFSY